MYIVFTVQPLVCNDKNDMEKVGQEGNESSGLSNFSKSFLM